MGTKGSWQRKSSISSAKKKLNHDLAFGKITKAEYVVEIKKL